MKKLLFSFLIVGMTMVGIGCTNNNDSGNSSNNLETNDSSTNKKSLKDETIRKTLKTDKSNLSYQDFVNLKIDTTYNACKAAIGEANILIDKGNKKTYIWTMDDNKNISVTEENGKVVSKAQGLLVDKKSPITKAQYDKIKTGMTLEETEKILGKGVLTNSDINVSDDIQKDIYSYCNDDNSTAIITYEDGKVYSISQNNLK